MSRPPGSLGSRWASLKPDSLSTRKRAILSEGSMGWRLLKQGWRERFLNARLLAFRIVDLGMKLDRFEEIVGRRKQQFAGGFGRSFLHVEPGGEILGRKNNRHAVVQRRDCAVGGTGEDGDGVDLLALAVAPALVEAGEGDQLRTARAKQEGPALALGPGPFIEPIGRHEAAAVAHGLTERRLHKRVLGPGIDERREPLRV